MKIIRRLFDRGDLKRDLSVYGNTDVGLVRSKNEDYFELVPEKGLYIVADGMGGHKAGEVASMHAVCSICEYFNDERVSFLRKNPGEIRAELINSVQFAHRAIADLSRKKPEYGGMGTTMVVAFLHDNFLHTCHVGDSRAYIINEYGISQMTNDHSGVWSLVKTGKMTLEQARNSPLRNQISQALGAPFAIAPEYHRARLYKSDIVLLCSDGLWDMVDDDDIQSVVLGGESLEQIGSELIERANEAGGEDNITVVLIKGEDMVS